VDGNDIWFDDRKRFLKKRKCLNMTNLFLVYLFYLVQSLGILTTSIAASNYNLELIWLGVALNILASLINIYEKINNSILKKLMDDIECIKNGTYVDERNIIDVESNGTETGISSINHTLNNNIPSSTINPIINSQR
jgi:hypothetical protein